MDEVLNGAYLPVDELVVSIIDTKSKDGRRFFETPNEDTADASPLSRHLDFSAYGRDWQIEVRTRPLFFQRLHLVNPALIGAVTCALGLLVTIILHLYFVN